MINLLTRQFDQYTGQIKIGQVDIQKLSLDEVHQQVAVALQDSLLFSGTIEDNLNYGKSDDALTLDQATQTAEAFDFIQQSPYKYLTPVEQAGKNFSGGQRQRLNLSRAIVPNHNILVLDDATSAVDQATNARIKHNLKKLRAKQTTLIISQRVTNVMDCDEIIVLKDGKLTAQGTHEELLRQSPFYRDLIKTQLGDVDFDA